MDKVTVTRNFSHLLPHVDIIKRLSSRKSNSLPTSNPMYSDPLCWFPHACKALWDCHVKHTGRIGRVYVNNALSSCRRSHHYTISFSTFTFLIVFKLCCSQGLRSGGKGQKIFIINKSEGKAMSKTPYTFQNHWCKDITKTQDQKSLSRQWLSVNHYAKNPDKKWNHQVAEGKQFQLEIFVPWTPDPELPI